MRFRLWKVAMLLLFCVLISSCKTTVSIYIPLSALLKSTMIEVPIKMSSDTCAGGLGFKKLGMDVTNVLCDGAGGRWSGSIQLVDHNTKEMLLKQPLTIYHGSGNNIIIYIREDALKALERQINPSNVRFRIQFSNDTEVQQEMYVRGIWVNGNPIGSEGGLLVVPPEVELELELSDVATTMLLINGMEGVGMFPYKE